MSSPSPLGVIREANRVSKKLLNYIVSHNNLAANMSRSAHEDQILIAIDQLRRRKTRTDLEGICNFMTRRFSVATHKTITVLNVMLMAKDAKVMAVSCKGGRGTSYRRAKPGIGTPVKVGDDVSEEVATAMISAALCEMILVEPDYLETGVPLDAFEKFMYDKDNVRFSVPIVLSMVRTELNKGNLKQRADSGNLVLAAGQPGCLEDQLGDRAVTVKVEELVAKLAEAEGRDEAVIAVKNEVKALKTEVKTESKENSEEEESGNANGGTPNRKAGVPETEGGRLRRKRAARVMFDPSDIPPPPKKKKLAVKDTSPATNSHRKTLSEEKTTISHAKKPTPTKTSGERMAIEMKTISQDKTESIAKLVKQEKKGFSHAKMPADEKTSASNQAKNASDAEKSLKTGKLQRSSSLDKAGSHVKAINDDKVVHVIQAKAKQGVEKSVREIKLLSSPEALPHKMIEVYSPNVSKSLNLEKESVKIMVKEKSTAAKSAHADKSSSAPRDGRSLIQARTVSYEKSPKDAAKALAADRSPSTGKLAADRSPSTGKLAGAEKLVRGDKLAFALAEVCHVCHRQPDDTPLMTCTGCANTAHVRCTERRDAVRRDTPWRCVHCKTCCVCAETDEYAAMVVCCRCEDAYHLSCHPTQEEEEGSANWLCAKCLVLPRDRQPDVHPTGADMDDGDSDASSGRSSPAAIGPPLGGPAPGPAFRDHSPNPEVPDATAWTVEQVADYFTSRGYHMQGKALKTHEVDGSALLLMRRGDVISGLDLPLGPALKALRQVRRLQLRRNEDHLLWT